MLRIVHCDDAIIFRLRTALLEPFTGFFVLAAFPDVCGHAGKRQSSQNAESGTNYRIGCVFRRLLPGLAQTFGLLGVDKRPLVNGSKSVGVPCGHGWISI